MPIIQDIINTCDKIKDLHRRKNDDYAGGGDGDPFFNFNVQEYLCSLFKKERDKVFVNLIAVKLARLASLLNQNGKANHESVDDSFEDLATYILLMKADVLRRREIKSKVVESELNSRVDAINNV